MRIRGRGRTGGWLVSLLIVALLPTPLPRVEYHNVRHHDAPGEVCEYHDHLLRWHPDATDADDVPVLHWHWGWLAPGGDDADAGHSGPDVRLHANHPDGAIRPDDPGPMLVAPPGGPAHDRLDRSGDGWPVPAPCVADLYPLIARTVPPRPDGARQPAPSTLPLHARLGRWSC